MSINRLVSQSERIGMIGSPSTTSELTLDILGSAVKKKLVGELAFFKFEQDGKPHYSIGQITEIELRNSWLEDSTIRSLARSKGPVSPVSEKQDTHLGKMTISATFSDEGDAFEQSILGTVPATGTYIHIADDELISTLLKRYEHELFYLGKVYGSSPKLPLWFKHFARGPSGAGEAYHLGIFGKTGSGKSVLAKMILLGYARHKNMSIFVLDPQGEFAKDISGSTKTGFKNKYKMALEKIGREAFAIGIKKIVLNSWETFIHILCKTQFFPKIRIASKENRYIAAEGIKDELRKKKVTLKDLHKWDSFKIALDYLNNENNQKVIYRTAQSREEFKAVLNSYLEDEDKKRELYETEWKPVCELFREKQGAYTIESLIRRAFNTPNEVKPLVVVDLSYEQTDGLYWDDEIQALILKELFSSITRNAEQSYKNGKELNTLVILDEAHRIAPSETKKNEIEQSVKRILVDAVRTTRKYGLGWMFVSQTLSSLDREIIGQIRTFFFGFGLSQGSEFNSLKELVGDQNSLKLYQSFRDPHSAFDEKFRQYSFMTIGPVSPLSFSGTPLFFTAFSPEQFLKVNFDID